ncbi:MAG: MOSC domain-containing protein [Mycobacteriales bacterium]
MTVTVVRLQVQRGRLKPGEPGQRVYDPSPLLEVDALEVGPRGCVGLVGGERVVDVHHADHPETRNRELSNGLSLLPQAHYDVLQQRYGPHLRPGSAGESLLLDGPVPEGDLLLETDGAPLRLVSVLAAPPCVEFSRFCLGLPLGPVGPDVRQALVDLGDGVRGHLARVVGTGVVRVGARLAPAAAG